jgi:hypothetical protein
MFDSFIAFVQRRAAAAAHDFALGKSCAKNPAFARRTYANFHDVTNCRPTRAGGDRKTAP